MLLLQGLRKALLQFMIHLMVAKGELVTSSLRFLAANLQPPPGPPVPETPTTPWHMDAAHAQIQDAVIDTIVRVSSISLLHLCAWNSHHPLAHGRHICPDPGCCDRYGTSGTSFTLVCLRIPPRPGMNTTHAQIQDAVIDTIVRVSPGLLLPSCV